MAKASIQSVDMDMAARKIIFKPSSWLGKIHFINHLVMFNNILMAVLAEQGGGKTSFVNLLKSQLDACIQPYTIQAIRLFNQASLLHDLAINLNLHDVFELSLANLIHKINERRKHVLIIIDDAHYLPDTFLQSILTELSKQGDTGYFHVCLVSNFSLLASLHKLAAESFKDLIHSIELGSLTEAETKIYLQSLLLSSKRLIGEVDKPLEWIYKETGGNIARINSQLIDFTQPPPTYFSFPKRSFPTPSRWSLVAGFLIAISTLIFIGEYQGFLPAPKFNFSPPKSPQLASTETKGERYLLNIVPDKNTDRNAPVHTPVTSTAKGHPLTSKIPNWHAITKQPMLDSFAMNNAAVGLNNIEKEEDKNDLVITEEQIAELAAALEAHSQQQAQQIQPKAKSTKNHAKRPTLPPPHRVYSKRAKAKTHPKTAISHSITTKEYYTIQLIASSNLARLRHFIRAHHLKNNAVIKQVYRQGTPWYVLTLGNYKEREEALLAKNNLPRHLAHLHPWIRATAELETVG